MLFVHHVLNESRRRPGYTALCKATIKLAEDIDDLYRYQAVKEADRRAPIAR
jgi:hypothetical protein